MNIKIKKHFLLYKGYKLKCSIGKSGLSHSKKEGDLTTPKGLYKLGLLYYRKDRIKLSKCAIKKKIIKKNMGWCDDSKSRKYNQEISFPFKVKSSTTALVNPVRSVNAEPPNSTAVPPTVTVTVPVTVPPKPSYSV